MHGQWSFKGAAIVAKLSLIQSALAALLLGAASFVSANPGHDSSLERITMCLQGAAKYQNQDPALLKAIALQESGLNPLAVNQNSNGTKDRGLLQINDIWLPKLKKFGISESDLFDPCVSAYVGAWVLAQAIAKHGPTWRAVGAYNAGSSPKREAARARYAQKIMKRYMKAKK